MFECFLLLLQKGAKWIPLVAIPAVLAGIVASICLMAEGRNERGGASKRRATSGTGPSRGARLLPSSASL
jgi:hypothetical protein